MHHFPAHLAPCEPWDARWGGKGRDDKRRYDRPWGGKKWWARGPPDFDVDAFLKVESWYGRERACTLAIKQLGSERRADEALEVLHSMRSRKAEPNVIHYNAAISSCAKAAKYTTALELLSLMEKRGVTPDVITYSSCISACDKGSQWTTALELLQSMENRGLQPDAIIFNATISACTKSGQWEHALRLFSEMRKHSVQPNETSVHVAMQACAEGGAWSRALSMLGPKPADPTLDLAVRACGQGGAWVEALTLLRRMRACGAQPSLRACNATLGALPPTAWSEALGLLGQMERTWVTPDARSYACVVSVCKKANQAKQVDQVLTTMRQQGLSLSPTLGPALPALKVGDIPVKNTFIHYDECPDLVPRAHSFR